MTIKPTVHDVSAAMSNATAYTGIVTASAQSFGPEVFAAKGDANTAVELDGPTRPMHVHSIALASAQA